jgi:SAM-dependent methyltransferase
MARSIDPNANTHAVRGSARAIHQFKSRVSLRKRIGGVDYTRSVEYPLSLRLLELDTARRVLEIGSSKLFLAPYIAVEYGVETHATDLDPVVWRQEEWISALGRRDLLDSGRFVVAEQDARNLEYEDEAFDRVVSISTIEHIRDIHLASAEIGRVLAPGGRAVITVPFSRRQREVWVKRDVYSRSYDGSPLFYEYVMDHEQLNRDIVAASGLALDDLRFLGEPGFKMSRLVYHPILDRPLSILRWIWPRAAHRWLREISESEITDTKENIAVVTLRKPGS